MAKKEFGFATTQIHAGTHREDNGALAFPIYATSTFVFDNVEQGAARFAGEEEGYIYSRLGNPSVTQVEEKVAALEGGEAAMATASGMGAISAALWSILAAGDEVVASDTLYGCTFALLNTDIQKFGVKVTFVDMGDPENVKKALTEKTKVVYFETPCNPTLKIVDIAAVSTMAHDFNPEIKVVVDNTFPSPYLQNPLKLGADVVVCSATKYINGHGDVIAGFVVGDAEYIMNTKMTGLKNMTGTVMSPFSAFLINRGLKTLNLRMERHCANAMKVAEFLHDHPAVDKVYYPGLESDPGYEVQKKQADGPGAMISFTLKKEYDYKKFFKSTKLVTLAESLGGVESLLCHPSTMTHAAIPKEIREEVGITDELIRLSVGIEDVDDIIADLEQAITA